MAVKIAIIGAGKFGEVHLKVFKQLEMMGVAELKAFSTIKQAEIDLYQPQYGVKGYLDYKEMLEKEDLDGVTVVTPDFLHREIAVYAANQGKHILVEKPLDITVEGCTEIMDAAKKNNVLLEVDFHKRFDPDHIAVEQGIKDGKLGDILYCSAYMEDRIEIPTEWFPNWAPKGSPGWFLGSHFADLILWMTKSTGGSVYACGSKKTLLNDYGIDMYDSVSALIKLRNGASFCLDTSWIIPKGFEAVVNQGMRIVGTKGVWEVDSQDRGARSCSESEGMRTWNNNFMREEKDKLGRTVYKGYGVDSIADFAYNIEFLKNGGALADLAGTYAAGEDGLEVTRICAAMHQSLASGEVVKL